jgi:hypothetical protein
VLFPLIFLAPLDVSGIAFDGTNTGDLNMENDLPE